MLAEMATCPGVAVNVHNRTCSMFLLKEGTKTIQFCALTCGNDCAARVELHTHDLSCVTAVRVIVFSCGGRPQLAGFVEGAGGNFIRKRKVVRDGINDISVALQSQQLVLMAGMSLPNFARAVIRTRDEAERKERERETEDKCF